MWDLMLIISNTLIKISLYVIIRSSFVVKKKFSVPHNDFSVNHKNPANGKVSSEDFEILSVLGTGGDHTLNQYYT